MVNMGWPQMNTNERRYSAEAEFWFTSKALSAQRSWPRMTRMS